MDLDMAVLDFLLEERAAGRPVSNRDLKDKARELANEIDGLDNFQGSNGWLRRWKKRNSVGIRRGTNDSQKLPEDCADLIDTFKGNVDRRRIENDYTDANIANMDETMCRFDMAPRTTNNIQGERDIRITTTGGARKGFTVALTATANGTKMPAYVIFKEGARARIPARVYANLRIPPNVRVSATRNGWMTGDEMEVWANRIWGPNRDDVRRLLILDRARVHTMNNTQRLMENLDTDLEYIPPGCTFIVQPADVSWNAPFKQHMREAWKAWRQRDLRTPQGNLRPANRQDVINCVSQAWEAVSEEVVAYSFKATGLSVALDGSEDDILSDRLSAALDAADRNVREEAIDLIFDDGEESDDTDPDFSGFSDIEDE